MMDIEEVKLLLAHEVAHLRRQDAFWNSLQSVVELFLYFHPAARLLAFWIRSEREYACDDLVLSEKNADPLIYANALTGLVVHDRWFRKNALAANGPPLRRRVERVLRVRTVPRTEFRQQVVCWLSLCVGLVFSLHCAVLPLSDVPTRSTVVSELAVETASEPRLSAFRGCCEASP
jgi:beta-lactamase regulating signal transducer with metallopeptidase domain